MPSLQVKGASKTAFEHMSNSDTHLAIDALCKLIGVGPATSVAILSCIDNTGSTCFMGKMRSILLLSIIP
jgi:hypothetical protein